MTELNLKNISLETITCDKCKRDFSSSLFRKKRRKICKICLWEEVHKDKMKSKKYSFEFLNSIVTYLFTHEESIVNDLASQLNTDIETIIDAIKEIGIVKKTKVKYNCCVCEKPLKDLICNYRKQKNHYCNDCTFRPKPKGENSPFYKPKVKVICNNCNKETYIEEWRLQLKNSLDERHNFCSHKCYSEFRSKYYVGEKHTKVDYTPDKINRLREGAVYRLKNTDRLNTGIQIKVDQFLQDLNIDFEKEYSAKYYAIDDYLKDYNLFIEVQGNYWHVNPLRYNKNKYLINKKQYEGIHRDKLKHSYIKNHFGKEILYLWESDIDERPEMCKILILKYIEDKGILKNYNSFNYELVNEKIILKDKLVLSYQEMSCSKYKNLIKSA